MGYEFQGQGHTHSTNTSLSIATAQLAGVRHLAKASRHQAITWLRLTPAAWMVSTCHLSRLGILMAAAFEHPITNPGHTQNVPPAARFSCTLSAIPHRAESGCQACLQERPLRPISACWALGHFRDTTRSNAPIVTTVSDRFWPSAAIETPTSQVPASDRCPRCTRSLQPATSGSWPPHE